MADLTAAEIEEINAAGPYNHSVWCGRGATVTQEDGITGRAKHLAAMIAAIIRGSFSEDDLAKKSIVDVGCYDGWLIEQLSKLPFARLVGIEPRDRNIEKGRTVRRILQISSRVAYRRAGLENLGSEAFDIVVCAGVLHHVESIGSAIRNLFAICEDMLIIELHCLADASEDQFMEQIEPKDIAYFSCTGDREIGIVGHKFETNYYDGSADRSSVVGVPSVSAVKMFLRQAGFEQIDIAMNPSRLWHGSTVGRTGVTACIVARKARGLLHNDNIAREYEDGLASTFLDDCVVRALYEYWCEGKEQIAEIDVAEGAIAKYIEHGGKFESEIARNLRFNPRDKIALEMAKIHFRKKDYRKVIDVGRGITTRVNADWRACYRVLVLMALAAKELNDSLMQERYCSLAMQAHPDPGSLSFK